VKIGNDTTFCQDCFQDVELASQLSITGGIPPYSYLWLGTALRESLDQEKYYPAGYFLNDTTLANPRFIATWYDGLWNRFKLTVKDAEGNIATDSFNIRFSEYPASVAREFPIYVNLGDSLFFNFANADFGGIHPYKNFVWTPQEGLSDPESSQTWCKPREETRYSCIFTDSVGCVGYINTQWIIVNVNSIKLVNPLKIYQSGGTIFLDNHENQDVLFFFYDLSGKLRLEDKTKSNSYTPNFSNNQRNTVFLCQIVTRDYKQTIKYIIQ
jgi:hypothetical protein